MSAAHASHLKACHCCGLVHTLEPVPAGRVACCSRCGARLTRHRLLRNNNAWAAAATWSALMLWPLGITLPVLAVERFGQVNEASIWRGTVSMLSKGEYVVGGVVLLCSVVIPLCKLLGLVVLTSGRTSLAARHRASTYRIIEYAGRWGMVDVLLVALMVAFLKLGDVVDVTPGPGVIAFTLCVLLSLVGSACFDPHALWERES